MLRAPGSFTSGLMLAVLGVGPSAPATKRGSWGRGEGKEGGFVGGRVFVAGGARQWGRAQVHLTRQRGHPVVLLRHAGGAEGVGLDQVGACGQIVFVDVAD